MRDHIHLAISVDISEVRGDRDLIARRSQYGRVGIDPSMGTVSSRQFKNEQLSMQVQEDKMRRVSNTIVVSYHLIRLPRARITILCIDLMCLPKCHCPIS